MKLLTQFTRKLSYMSSNKGIDGPIIKTIIAKIQGNFPNMAHFAIYNDSYKHSHHKGIENSSNKNESHIRLEIVDDIFEGLNLLKRHRLIYTLLDNEIKLGNIHALQLTTRTVSEHTKAGTAKVK